MKRMLVLIAVLAATPAYAGTHKDERWGFKLKIPAGWKQAAMSASEEWIAAKFLGKRDLVSRPDKEGWTVSEHAQIWVIGFPHARLKDRGAKVEKKGDTRFVSFKNPYKDYKDFVKRERWFVGGGYHFSVEEETTIKDVKVTQYEIKVEKATGSPFRIVTWIYHFEDIDFAVQCKILESHYKSHKNAFRGTLKSFRRISRTEAMPGAAKTGKSIVEEKSEDDMTPEERAKRRQDNFDQTLRKELDALPKGWYQLRSKNYVVLSNADKKFAREALKHADGIRRYLDKTFAGIGEGYVPTGLIRVFASSEEERAYSGGTSAYWADDVVQVLISQSRGMNITYEFKELSSRITSQYFSFKNKLLSGNMPWWFRNGLMEHMGAARVKGKSVKFVLDDWDRDRVKQLIRDKKALDLKTLFSQGSKNDFDFDLFTQAGSVCSFMLTKANRGKTKGAIQEYLKNLIAVIEEVEKEIADKQKKVREEMEKKLEEQAEEGEFPVEEETEESEDEEGEAGEDEEEGVMSEEMWKKLREETNKRNKVILAKAFERTFGELKDKDWRRLDKMWRAYVK